MNNTISIDKLVYECSLGERTAQKLFYQRFYGFGMSVCLRYCSNENDSEEVLNNSFIKIFRKIVDFVDKKSDLEASLKSWMKSIFINSSIDYYRKYYRRNLPTVHVEQHEEAAQINNLAFENITIKEILYIVQELSPQYRLVFNLFVFENLTHEKISKLLNISEGTSKSNLAKARFKIRQRLSTLEKTGYEKKAI